MTANISEFAQAWWLEARKKVKNAIVFLDPVMCECLHWAGGLPFLMEYGASGVKEFSTFEAVPITSKKAVFILSSAIHGTNYDILEHLIKGGSKLEYCVVISSAHSSLQNLLQWSGARDSHQELEGFQNLEEDILDWMGNMNYTVEVLSYPLSTVHPTLETFLIPTAKSLVPFFPNDLGYINDQLALHNNSKQAESSVVRSINELTYASLPFESQAQVRQLCHNLNQLLQHVNGKEEIFTVGSLSRIIGTELEALNAARTRRKTAINKISVILVDRVLDLASVTKFTSDNLYDRMIHTIDRLHEYSNDVSICMTDNKAAFNYSAPGCLAPQSDWKHGWKLMEQLFHKSRQQAAERITSELVEACNEDDQSSLAHVLTRRSNDWDFIERFTHLYQAARGVLQSQSSGKSDRLNRLEAIQKSLMESVDDPDSPSPLIQILHLIKTRKESGLKLDDILVLLVHLYSLAGGLQEELFTLELEDRLKSLLAENMVHEDENLSQPLQDFVGVPIDEVKAHRAAQKIVEQLHHIGYARNNMKKYGSLYRRINPAMPVENTSFLQQLIEDIFDPAVVDNPDMEHKSAGLKDLLKTGFSLFVNVRKPKPSDNPIVFLYVVGGIRPDEVKLIRQLFRLKSPSHSVLIGSSHFVSAHDIAQQFLLKKNPTS